jgi:CelD/BcsL family acetyltransferase involved in cellulose biosynthesis
MSGEWKTTVARSLDDVAALRPTWEDMLSREPNPTLMADLDRYLTLIGARHHDVEPHVMAIERDGHAEVMVVARVERHKLPCRVGYLTLLNPSVRCLSIVHGGILGQPTGGLCEAVFEALVGALDSGVADVAFFNHLPVDSDMFALIQAKRGLLAKARVVGVEEHWRTSIPDTAEELTNRFSKKRKREWNRLGRKLEEKAGDPLSVRCQCREEDVTDFVAMAAQMSTATYKDKLDAGFKDTPLTRTLLMQAAGLGRWRGYVLYAGDTPCAFESGVVYRGCFFAEAMGYDPAYGQFSPGTILWIKVLEELSKDPGVHALDYGFGGAQYKERFGTDHWSEASPYVFAHKLYPALVGGVYSCVGGLNAGLQRVGAKIGLGTSIKRRWRRRLQYEARKDKKSAKSG